MSLLFRAAQFTVDCHDVFGFGCPYHLQKPSDELGSIKTAAAVIVQNCEKILGLIWVDPDLLKIPIHFGLFEMLKELLFCENPILITVSFQEDLVNLFVSFAKVFKPFFSRLQFALVCLIQCAFDDHRNHHIENGERSHMKVQNEKGSGPGLELHDLSSDVCPALRGGRLKKSEHTPEHCSKVLINVFVASMCMTN
eukprot:Skav210209  [mRNA]  locus=scaffold440:25237:29288:+ [translate_table: standard]